MPASLVGGPLLVGGLGPGPPRLPLKSGPDTTYWNAARARPSHDHRQYVQNSLVLKQLKTE